MKLSVSALSAAVCFFAFGTCAHAQAGPFIDWIHKLSGPQFFGFGVVRSFGPIPGRNVDGEEFGRIRLNYASLVMNQQRLPAGLDTVNLRWLGVAMDARRESQINRCLDSLQGIIAQIENTALTLSVAGALEDSVRAISDEIEHTHQAYSMFHEGLPVIIPKQANVEPAGRICNMTEVVRRAANDPVALAPESGLVVHAAGFWGLASDPGGLGVLTARATAGYLTPWNFSVQPGLALHLYYGEDIRRILNYSIPIYVRVYPFTSAKDAGANDVRIVGAVHAFHPFRAGAFLPTDDRVLAGRWEVTWEIAIEFDTRRPKMPTWLR